MMLDYYVKFMLVLYVQLVTNVIQVEIINNERTQETSSWWLGDIRMN
jgi:hypothetical protein